MNRALLRIVILILRFVEFQIAADLLLGAAYAVFSTLRRERIP